MSYQMNDRDGGFDIPADLPEEEKNELLLIHANRRKYNQMIHDSESAVKNFMARKKDAGQNVLINLGLLLVALAGFSAFGIYVLFALLEKSKAVGHQLLTDGLLINFLVLVLLGILLFYSILMIVKNWNDAFFVVRKEFFASMEQSVVERFTDAEVLRMQSRNSLRYQDLPVIAEEYQKLIRQDLKQLDIEEEDNRRRFNMEKMQAEEVVLNDGIGGLDLGTEADRINFSAKGNQSLDGFNDVQKEKKNDEGEGVKRLSVKKFRR